MTLKTQIAADLPVFFDRDIGFARYVGYYPVSGGSALVTAVVEQDEEHQEPYVRGLSVAKATIHVQKSEVSDPQRGDRYVWADESWEMDPIRGVIYEDSLVYTIGLEKRM